MSAKRIAVVGCGVIGNAIIKSLIGSGVSPQNLVIREKREERLSELQIHYGVSSGPISDCEVVFLAIKPQDLGVTVSEIGNEVRSDALMISLMAGVSISILKRAFNQNLRIIRLMPNTPLLVGEGMSVISPGIEATAQDISWVEEILSSSGKTLVQSENLMDAATAVSGSGPAYFFGFIEAMIKSAINLGLSDKDSQLLVQQTLIGAAKMVQESGKDAATLRGEVTSPNGTTAAALSSFESSGWEEIVYRAMKAARDRSRELSN